MTTDESSPNRVLAGEIAGADGDGIGVAAAALVDAAADAVGAGVVGAGSLGLTPGEADGSADARGSAVFGSTVVYCDQRYSRIVSPESWIAFASSGPTYR
jgi:hypothetical protein